MGVIRGNLPTDQFLILPNYAARDRRLSLRDKGLLTYILSHSTGYDLTIEQMIADSTDGRTSVRAGIAALIEHGYLKRSPRKRDERGWLRECDYFITLPVDGPPSSVTQQDEGLEQLKLDETAGEDQGSQSFVGQEATKKTSSKKTKEDQVPKPAVSAPPSDPDEISPMKTNEILGGWIDFLSMKGITLPGRMKGMYARYIKEVLDSGIGDKEVRLALGRMFDRGQHAKPSLLSSFVVEVQSPATSQPAPAVRSFRDQEQDAKRRQRLVYQVADRIAEEAGVPEGQRGREMSSRWIPAAEKIVREEEMSRERSSHLYNAGEAWTTRPALEVANVDPRS